MSAQTRSEIKQMLESHGLAPMHRLGQHFLADPNITRKIVEVSGVGPGDQVLEIGAGTGTLTSALAESGARVVAYEIDPGLRPVLEEVTEGTSVDLRFEDITKVDLSGIVGTGSWALVANLPYNVGTPLLMDALRYQPSIVRFVVMVQREVADRLVAGPGTDAYGLPSVVASIHSDARLEFTVAPQVFYPRPNVESAVVTLSRRPTQPNSGAAIELARSAFGQRRKMLRGALASVLDDPAVVIEEARIDPRSRAEDLSPDDYLRLAAVVA